VLFDGSARLQQAMVAAVATSPAAAPFGVIVDALTAAAEFFADLRDWATKRTAVIAATPSLQERELLKLHRMSEAIANALVARGTEPAQAALAADLGVAVFHRSFQLWISGDNDFGSCVRATLHDFARVTADASLEPETAR
jgi:hypothetical protein